MKPKLGKNNHKPGRPTKKEQGTIFLILKSYWDGEPKSSEIIAKETGLNRKTVNRYFRQFSKDETKKMDKESIEECTKNESKEHKINGQNVSPIQYSEFVCDTCDTQPIDINRPPNSKGNYLDYHLKQGHQIRYL